MTISRSIHVAANDIISEEQPYDQYPLNFLKTFYNFSEALLSLLFSFLFFPCCFLLVQSLLVLCIQIKGFTNVSGLTSFLIRHVWLQLSRLLCPLDSPHKSIGVGCHFLLQGILLTQGLNLGLLHCRQIFLSSEPPASLSHQVLLC